MLRTTGLAIVSLSLASCMHWGMMGGNGDSEFPAESIVEKEVVVENIRAIAVFPPLLATEGTQFVLKLSDAQSAQPISGAVVRFHEEYVHEAGGHPGNHIQMHDGEDSIHEERTEDDRAVSFSHQVEEGSMPGEYSIMSSTQRPGEYKLSFHVTHIGERTLDRDIILETTKVLEDSDQHHGGGMHGSNAVPVYVVIGAAVMGAMMVAMWIARGGL